MVGNVNQHSEELIGLIDSCLKDANVGLAEVDQFAICQGPGSFTGLRIGMATLKGLAFANQKPLVSVSSLEIIATEMMAEKQNNDAIYCSVLDARREEIFVAFYKIKDDALIRVGNEEVLKPAQLKELATKTLSKDNRSNSPMTIAGNGLEKYPELKEMGGTVFEKILTPNPVTLANIASTLASADNWELMGPTYIRKSEAEIKFPDGNPGGTFKPGQS
jgi:tRNA threonylcarbamoyl adenosine modification protein YeaZ